MIRQRAFSSCAKPIWLPGVMLVVLLTGCAPGTLERPSLARLGKGQSMDQIRASLRPPRCTVEFASPAATSMDIYEMVETHSSRWYYLLYRDSRLVYWGYEREFFRPEVGEYRMLIAKAASVAYAGRCADGRVLNLGE